MDAHELLWRAGQALRFDLRLGRNSASGVDWDAGLGAFREGSGRPTLLDAEGAADIAERKPEFVMELVEAAGRAERMEFSFFGYPPAVLPSPVDWKFDPVSCVHWPAVPARRIDYRTAGGDVKWIWELNRLQHLPWLAQAWLFTGDRRFSKAAFSQLESWIGQNPPGVGVAWRSPLEAGIRAVSVAIALQGLRDAPELTVDLYRRIVTMLARSASRCWIQRSRFSSANAHLIGEMAGLFVISTLFPELKLSDRWERCALATLCMEAEKQVLPDGSGAEQAIGYQVSTAEFLQLVAVLLVIRDGSAPNALAGALARSARFLSTVVGSHDPDPRWGDSDEGFALRLGPEEERTIREHLGIVGACGWGGEVAELGHETLTAEWYRTRAGFQLSGPKHKHLALQEVRAFHAADGGVVILRSADQRVMMDVGQLGYLSIAAHGHADALSVTVSQAGQDVIGDPGPGSYYHRPGFRSVMRGTRAHSTVCVDEQDQSVSGGPFLWVRHAKTTLRSIDLQTGFIDAEHDGYCRLPGSPVHRRVVSARQSGSEVLILDLLTGRGMHRMRTTWPLHPLVNVRPVPFGYELSWGMASALCLLQAATARLEIDDARGDAERNLGWWSDRLERRSPTWWLSSFCEDELPVAIATLIGRPSQRCSDLAIAFVDQSVVVTWYEASGDQRVEVKFE